MADPMSQSTDSALIAASKVEGKAVFNANGEKLGTIKDIYIDKTSGEVMFAALAFGGVLGMGERYHPFPWDLLDYSVEQDGFVVDVDRRNLEGSPAYDEDSLAADAGWGGEVRTYYASRGGVA